MGRVASLLTCLLFALPASLAAKESCSELTPAVAICAAYEDLSDAGAMEIAFPNSRYVALTPEDNRYGVAVAVIPGQLSGAGKIDTQSLFDVPIVNAISRTFVETTVDAPRFRGARLGAWHGVQAKYRIVGASERLATSYVVDAYLMQDTSEILAIQAFSDAAAQVTETQRALHQRHMQELRVTQ
ncbi:MAG: hypothetical protein MK180_10035 [Rhodobacteraceae bacterium]|nr:hypothetical protein [Paracoccaceae bacterium]